MIDPVRLEARLTSIETKLNEPGLKDRVVGVEKDARSALDAIARLEERAKHLATQKDIGDLQQRVARLETRVAHLPSKGFIVTVISGIAALATTAVTLADKIKAILGLH